MPVAGFHRQYWDKDAAKKRAEAKRKKEQRAYGLIPKPSVDNAREPGGPNEGHPGWNSSGHSGWRK